MVKDILLVEDNAELANLIVQFLEKDGYQVEHVDTGNDAVRFLKTSRVKIVLLDIMLPDMDGFEICSAIRETDDVPVVFISARADKEDKMNGFRIGADDYVEKPVDMDLLNAKIGAILARNYDRKYKSKLVQSGRLLIDKEAQAVYVNDRQIPMTGKEYDLLLLLVENEGKVLKKEYIFQKIWGIDSESENQTLTVHIKMLRDKIEENPKKPKRIITVWGIGYRYEKM